MPTYPFRKQVSIIAATMTLHNYICSHPSLYDINFNSVDENQSYTPPEVYEYSLEQSILQIDDDIAKSCTQHGEDTEEMILLREEITNALVNE